MTKRNGCSPAKPESVLSGYGSAYAGEGLAGEKLKLEIEE